MGNQLKVNGDIGNLGLGNLDLGGCCSVKLNPQRFQSFPSMPRASEDKLDLRVKTLDLSFAPFLRNRVCDWLRMKLKSSPSPHLEKVLAMINAKSMEDQDFTNVLSESLTASTSVRNLFRILYVSSNFDKRFLELEFGINDRPMDPREMVSSQKWKGGLPLLVPIKHVMQLFPDHFVKDAREGYVFFSEAWPEVLHMLTEFFKKTFDDPDRIIKSFPWDRLRFAVTSSYLAYAHAWKAATKGQEDARDMLLSMEEKLPGDMLQPGTTQPLEALLEIAAKANKKMMEAIGGTWKQTGATSFVSDALPKDFPKCKVTCPGIKSMKRARQKADDKYTEKFGDDRYRRLRDLARLGFVFETIRGMWEGLARIRALFKVVAVENRFKCPTNIGWRDVTLLAEVDCGNGVQHIAEFQLHLLPLAECRDEEHKQYEYVREELGGELTKHSDKIITDILKTLEVQAPPNLQQPITAENGVLKLYFRNFTGTSVTVGERHEFAWSPQLTTLELHGLLSDAPTGSAKGYYARCISEGLKCRAVTDNFVKSLLETLKNSLFDEHGLICIPGACFLKEAGAPPRCTSREVPRFLGNALPLYLKTSGPLAAAENLQYFAEATGCEDLKARVSQVSPTLVGASDTSAFWHEMEWGKAADRGIIFLLQGVQSSLVHHIWSCADKPPRCDDGRFFKEANAEGFILTLRELVQEPDSSFGLTVVLRLLGGN